MLDTASLRDQRVLDVGCSTGEFLEAARDLFGIHPLGLDISPDAVAVLRGKGIDAQVATIEAATVDVCDLPAIIAIDVIEHVVDPVEFCRQVAARLRPGGVAYLETPNPYSTVYQLGAWASRLSNGRPTVLFNRLFPREHQYYLAAQALAETARLAGLDVVRLFTRRLPWSDLAISVPLKIAMLTLQLVDVIRGQRTLLCMLARKAGPAAMPKRDSK